VCGLVDALWYGKEMKGRVSTNEDLCSARASLPILSADRDQQVARVGDEFQAGVVAEEGSRQPCVDRGDI
jgi:hypothetical protein